MENRRNRRRMNWRAVVIAVTLCILGTGSVSTANKYRYSPEQFEVFVEELFKEEVKANTINLHFTLAYPENYGIEDYEATLGSFLPEDLEEADRQLEELKKELLKFDVSAFSGEQKLTYDILLDYVETQLLAKEFTLLTEALGPTTGYQVQLPMTLAEYTFRTPKDIEDYFALLSQIDDMAEEMIAFEKEKSKAGFFMPDYAVDAVISQCSEFIAEPENNYMIEVFNDRIDAFKGLSVKERESYKEKNRSLITTDVREGYEILIEGLKELKGSGVNEQGLCYYEGGKEYYEYLVRTATGSEDSVKELQKRTEVFIENCLQKIQEALLQDAGLYERAMNCEPSAAEPEEILKEAAEKAKGDFPMPPEVGYTIKYVHPSMQENSVMAYYLLTPVDDLQNNIIYINEKNINQEEGEETELYTTLVHEGYPGHLYQNVYTASCDLPLIRNLLSYPGYTEGWATYVECEYGYDFALEDQALADFFARNQLFSWAVSAYVDMGIHYDGWSRSDTKKYLKSLGIADGELADKFYEIFVEEPASYLSYFIGCLEFMELREKAQEALGEDFDVKEFHRFLLEIGPAPFYIIEDYMEGLSKPCTQSQNK